MGPASSLAMLARVTRDWVAALTVAIDTGA